jgi:hypothetical protein
LRPPLRNAKLKTGKRGQKSADWAKSIKEGRCALDCSAIEEEEGG